MENLLLKTSAESYGTLSEWREQLDEITRRILYLIAERQKIVRKIGEWKKINHLPVVDLDREAKHLGSLLELAAELGIDTIEVSTIICALLRLSREAQK